MSQHITKQKFIDRWLQTELRLSPDFIAKKLGYEGIIQLLKAELEISYNYLFSDELAQMNFEYCKIPGSNPEHYKYRQLRFELGEMVTSIRFLSRDLSKPNVFIIHKDFELKDISSISKTAKYLSSEYGLFKPLHIRWFSPENEDHLIHSHSSVSGDMVYYTAFLSDLKRAEKPAHFDRIKLVNSTGLEWYDIYQQNYEMLYQENPGSKDMASHESKETFQGLIDKDLLYEIYIDDKWAGVIGVDHFSEKFLQGYVIYEELLIEKFRSQGLAPAAQRHLIDRLEAGPEDQLYGTIHYGNVPSWKTAMKVGREFVGMYCMQRIN